jgi:hypothetical protein
MRICVKKLPSTLIFHLKRWVSLHSPFRAGIFVSLIASVLLHDS